jgi:hypothetical protein
MPLSEWKPSANDVTSFAAFRWFANSIENESMELYATDRNTYEHIEHVLRNTLARLAALRIKLALPPEDDCPDGWLLCNGVCKPSCDNLELAAPERQK